MKAQPQGTDQKGHIMGLRNLIRRRPVHRAPTVNPAAAQEPRNEVLPPRRLEAEAAWAELTAAAKGSAVTDFHAFTRTGKPWTEDPAAIRDVAATLGEFPARNGHQAMPKGTSEG